MGLDEGLIVEPGSIDESLRCPICLDVFDGPVHAHGVCEHTFCRSCTESALRRSPQCPLCRATVQRHQLKPFLAMQHRVDEVSVRCSRHLCGCPWIGPLAARATHDKECTFTSAEAQLRGEIRELELWFDQQERHRQVSEMQSNTSTRSPCKCSRQGCSRITRNGEPGYCSQACRTQRAAGNLLSRLRL
mmetsp:Transcript_53389/g.127343  ORF Transcript_53389/g.127343 Transcript_53389/m.127343 type:complete len:189 (+) Transcript_53389:93-659(+)